MKILFEYFLVIITTAILISCSEKSKSVDLDDIRPKSDSRVFKAKIIENDSSEFLLKSYQNDSIELSLTKLITNKKTTFLQRFPCKKSAFRTLISKDTNIQYQHELYEYVDSNQMKNAFFNWLDCNGKDCRSIKLYEETKIENLNLLIITTSKSIDIIRSNSDVKLENWIDYLRFSRKMSDFKYILYQKKNHKANWFVFKENKLVPKTKK